MGIVGNTRNVNVNTISTPQANLIFLESVVLCHNSMWAC